MGAWPSADLTPSGTKLGPAGPGTAGPACLGFQSFRLLGHHFRVEVVATLSWEEVRRSFRGTRVPHDPGLDASLFVSLEGIRPEDPKRGQPVAGDVEPSSDSLPCKGPSLLGQGA